MQRRLLMPDTKADVYSFSIVMYEILFAKEAWVGYSMRNLVNAIRQGQRPSIPESISAGHLPLLDLMKECWVDDPEKRPDFKTIILKFKRIVME